MVRDDFRAEVDVSGVTCIDVVGVRNLLVARENAVDSNHTFRLLAGGSGAVRRPLRLTQREEFG